MDAMVIYSSRTGNTRKVALRLFEAVQGELKDMQPISEYSGKDADVYFVGFWTNQGTCSMEVIDLLSGLHGKKVALFGTCGMGRDNAYYRSIEQRTRVWIPDDNVYMGMFMCQGKMPIQVRNKYEGMLKNGSDEGQMNQAIRNFDEALLHPDNRDLENATAFARKVMDTIGR